jgi:kynurenine 3-monooxygenase
MKTVSILGGGLVGPMMAMLLSKRNIEVNIFEKRPDPRTNQQKSGRTVNLALSERGWQALRRIGLADKVKHEAIPMRGRLIHLQGGEEVFQAYGNSEECIYSVSRGGLNKILIERASEDPNITFHFAKTCEDVYLENAAIKIKDNNTQDVTYATADCIIGADGISSRIRTAIQDEIGMNFERKHINYGYKELTIPATATEKWALDKNVLHIWPRGTFMFMALPNADGSFTGTLYAPYSGEDSFDSLNSSEKLRAFFKKYFSDVEPLMESLENEFFNYPVSSLSSVNCYPWAFQDKALIIGDAAHAILPFYGQGMNSGFEDCVSLDTLMDETENIEELFATFQNQRKPNTDALAKLSYNNFLEMRDHVKSPQFLLRKKIDGLLGEKYSDIWTPLYTMVAFRNLPFEEIFEISQWQNRVLDKIMQISDLEDYWQDFDYEPIFGEIKEMILDIA